MSQISEEAMQELKKQLMQSQLDSLRISMENLAHSFDRVPAAIIARLRNKLEKIQEFQELTRSFADDEKDDLPDMKQDRKASLLLYAESVMPLKHHYGNSLMISSDDDDIEAPYDRMLEKMEAFRIKGLRVPVTDDVVSVALRTYKDCRDLEFPVPQGLALHALSPLDTGEEWSVQEVEISSEPDSYPDGTTIEAITITREQLRTHYRAAEFKKEVPATHPTLDNLDLDFDKEISYEYGIVVAWRFVGSEAWKDRYGHLVPQDPLL
ncbi:hypothetical protein FDENT_8194 [Fusarium denticulatum]|uniref:Uncharacterized protein n=1 Tax=Fusarium denticulatum TaxID=48507 RepID=A0A8H5X4U2_9HYPO|nr:hypothetical protein FDENT_8194 [Fusarium denticulatum]